MGMGLRIWRGVLGGCASTVRICECVCACEPRASPVYVPSLVDFDLYQLERSKGSQLAVSCA